MSCLPHSIWLGKRLLRKIVLGIVRLKFLTLSSQKYLNVLSIFKKALFLKNHNSLLFKKKYLKSWLIAIPTKTEYAIDFRFIVSNLKNLNFRELNENSMSLTAYIHIFKLLKIIY